MNRICIMGATSPIGLHLLDFLFEKGYALNATYHEERSIPKYRSGNGRLRFCHADLTSRENLLDACKGCDTAIWLLHAWQNRPDHQEDELNISSLRWFCREIGRTGVKKIIFLSSGGSVYGEPVLLPVAEDHPRKPVSSYGKTKAVMEDVLLDYGRRKNIDIAILRPGNVYGTSSLFTKEKGVIAAYFRSVRRGIPFQLIGGGKDVRDYVHVSDVVRAIECALNAEDKEILWNVGTGTGTSVLHILELLRNIMFWKEPEIASQPHRKTDVSINILSSGRIREAAGWEHSIGLKDGLKLAAERLNMPSAPACVSGKKS